VSADDEEEEEEEDDGSRLPGVAPPPSEVSKLSLGDAEVCSADEPEPRELLVPPVEPLLVCTAMKVPRARNPARLNEAVIVRARRAGWRRRVRGRVEGVVGSMTSSIRIAPWRLLSAA
jgi:hypothetical protein